MEIMSMPPPLRSVETASNSIASLSFALPAFELEQNYTFTALNKQYVPSGYALH